MRFWDFVFYASFGVVVTSSVRIGGVLLVFSYLIVPALAGTAGGGTLAARLIVGWGFGALVSVIGMAASAALDLPTGAAVVCAFGLTLLALPWRPGSSAGVLSPAPPRWRRPISERMASFDDAPGLSPRTGIVMVYAMRGIGPIVATFMLIVGTVSRESASAQSQGEVHHIHGLAVDRQDPEVVYVATHTGLVRLRSKKAPEWIGEQRFDLMGFTAHPTEASLVYASGHPDIPTYAREKVGQLGLLVSRDGGRSWASVALKGRADFHALTYSRADGGQLFGWNVTGQPGLYRITTKTWEAERLPARGLPNVLALAASPDTVPGLFAGTDAGLRASQDGGVTWTSVGGIPGGAPVTAVSYHVSDPRRVYAYVHQRGAGLMRSVDGGAMWTSTSLDSGPDTPVVALSVGPRDHVVVATTVADIKRSRDGGRTWETLLDRGRPARDTR